MYKQSIAHNLEEKSRTKDVTLNENVSFDSLLLPEVISQGLSISGFRKPSPIQFKALPLGRCGFDLIVRSKAGTGKTLVFSLVALESVCTDKKQIHALILVPTREIAVQIQEVLKAVGCSIAGLNVEYFIGGLSLDDDIKKAKDCHIAVGAPGRINHLISLGALSTKHIRLFVLDEADKLMEPSFQSDINEIYNTLPERKQMIASSATYTKELESFLSNYMISPTHVSSEIETPILLGLKQFVSIIKTPSLNVVQLMRAKNEYLQELLSKIAFTQCLVFSNYQTRAESISNFLNQKGWNSIFISAAQSQVKRLQAVNNLKEFKNRILLSTDLTSRGIDAPNVNLVINYDIPQDAVTYLHRMGRAGRYGSAGICINLSIEGDELKQLQNILGTIGAGNLSISKTPPLDENNFDLWQLDSASLDQVHAIVSTDDIKNVNESIKNEIMTLKEKRKCTQSKKAKKVASQNSDENCITSNGNCVMNILNKSKNEFSQVSESLASVDTQTLLESLVSGDNKTFNVNEDSQYQKLEVDSKHLLQLLASTESEEIEDDIKKRKRDASNEVIIKQKEKKLNSTKNATFCKNRALLDVTRLLCNPNVQIESDILDSVHDYLDIIKNQKTNNDDLMEQTVSEILSFEHDMSEINNLENRLKTVDTSDDSELNTEFNIENIFNIAYKCAVNKEEKSWINYLPPQEIEHFKQACREDIALSSDSDEEIEDKEYYEDVDYEMESENNLEVGHQEEQAIGPWVPVVHEDSLNVASSEHFEQCFEDCSTNLWQNGLSFENVGDFDDWFYQWQQELHSVRNYVQHNVYVREMSKYQNSKRQGGF